MIHACIHVFMYVCMHACIGVCVYVCIVCVCVCVCIYIHVYIYVCAYMHVFITWQNIKWIQNNSRLQKSVNDIISVEISLSTDGFVLLSRALNIM